MNFRDFLVLLLASLFVPALSNAAPKATPPPYKGAIAMDAATGATLFESNADIRTPPASVTKLMTFLVVHDRIRSGNLTLETPVPITAADSKIGGTQVWLKEKEVFTVEELLYALMIQSANDAAHALARVAAGSREGFVELMNERAKSLGMTQTVFRTPHGLPPASRKTAEGDLTTPRDLAILSRALLQETEILRFTSVKERNFREAALEPVVMRNHNHLLGKVAGVDGLKTGFTNGAGYCLAATAERQGRRVIVVVMGSPDRKTRDLEVANLLERAFAQLPTGPSTPISPVAGESPIQRAQPTRPAAAQPTPTKAPTPTQPPPPTVTFPGVKKR
jgi:D-alanyl-D-alanine carboxypeptidase